MAKKLLRPIPSTPDMPKGVTIHRKSGQDSINSIEDFTFVAGNDGFVPLENPMVPGGDVSVAFFRTNAEVYAFYSGFSLSAPGDDIQYTVERIKVRGRNIFAFLALFTDSGDDALYINNYL